GREGPGARIADLCDAVVLQRLGTAPDRVASRHRTVTQPIARAIWEAEYAGLRWWSRFWGDWHTTVLFTARLTGEAEGSGGVGEEGGRRGDVDGGSEDAGGGGRRGGLTLRWGEPEALTTRSPAVEAASRLLGMEVTTGV
ncbi:MAG TPA: hypothetical protein VE173_06485, partial [Longimicrobiales bacterium]|nr:hypothetical protein [Longimicrobiales bacterium]